MVAGAAAAGAAPVNRDILALYDGRLEGAPHLTRIHRYAEMPLNHLGYKVTYWSLEKGLPEVSYAARYHAILTWFEQPVGQPRQYVTWAAEVARSGPGFVILGSIGVEERPTLLPVLNDWLGLLGLRHTGDHPRVPYRTRVVYADPGMIGFERPLDPVLPDFPVIVASDPAITTHLSMAASEDPGALPSSVVATGSKIGIVPGDFTIFYEPRTDRVQWILNPFEFFRHALSDQIFPIPDVTTISGRRLYFSHVDGDGWNNLTEIERYRDTMTLSSEVVLRELIEPYPGLPVTVGLIAGDIDPEIGGNAAAADVARRLFALPQVEVGSHTYSHPFNWRFFEDYERDAELALIEEHAVQTESIRERMVRTLRQLSGNETPRLKHREYIALTDDLPRTYLRQPFDLDREVGEALKISESLAPVGKRASLYQWSGDTTPFEAAVAATRKAGVRNINGGDSRFDADYPSVAYVPPISRPVGSERQIYAVNSNENTYTNDWHGPYYAFLMLSDTVAATNLPRRLKGFNLYYHMYSGEKEASVVAVKHHLETARQGRYAPIAASEYAAIADSFFGVKIEKLGEGRWAVSDRGALQTVRFDRAGQRTIDFVRSAGVIGYNHHAGSLYVSLDPAVGRAVVALATDGATRRQQAQAGRPYLVESRWRFAGFEASECGFEATATGFGIGRMTWAGLRPGEYSISARRSGETVWSGRATADGEGVARFGVPAGAMVPLRLHVRCAA